MAPSAPTLFAKHRDAALVVARDFFLPTADEDDIKQEALIALWSACRSYDPEHGIPFRKFAHLVVRRRLSTTLRLGLAEKHKPLTDALRVVETEDGFVEIVDTLSDDRSDVHRIAVARETLERMCEAVKRLTPIERLGLEMVVNGEPYVGSKRLDNAVQRARAKLSQ